MPAAVRALDAGLADDHLFVSGGGPPPPASGDKDDLRTPTRPRLHDRHPERAYRGHVLIVDDEPDIRETLRDLLTDEGYLPAEAENGQQALALIRASAEPLIVLLDYRMPRMSGDEVLRAVAADPELAARHAFVLVTANVLPAQPEFAELLASLSVPIVRKPFSLDGLMRAVEQAERRFDWLT
jgi:CheY-like chemotaxis protein